VVGRGAVGAGPARVPARPRLAGSPARLCTGWWWLSPRAGCSGTILRVRTRLAVIVAVLAVLGTGCGGGGPAHKSSDPPPTPSSSTPSSSSPATTSPTPTGPLTTGPGVLPGEKPPVLSAEAKKHTPTGALAFAVYYFKAFDWSVATNDPYLVSQVSAARCAACKRVIHGLAPLRSEGARLRGGRIRLESAKVVTGHFRFKSDLVVQVSLSQEAEVITRPPAPPSTAAPATTDVSLVFVTWVRSGWQVEEVGAPS
jgi:hypothetical protein